LNFREGIDRADAAVRTGCEADGLGSSLAGEVAQIDVGRSWIQARLRNHGRTAHRGSALACSVVGPAFFGVAQHFIGILNRAKLLFRGACAGIGMKLLGQRAISRADLSFARLGCYPKHWWRALPPDDYSTP